MSNARTPQTSAPRLRSARWRLLLALAAVAALAFGCFFAIDDDHAGHRATEPVAQPTARTSTGEEITRTEFSARVSAQQSLEQQPPQQQRRYYETWVGALQRSQATQQAILDQLRAQRDAVAENTAERTAIDERIASSEKQLADRAERLASFSAKADALSQP